MKTLLFKKLQDGVVVRLRQDFEHGESEMTSQAVGYTPENPCKLYFFRKGPSLAFDYDLPKEEVRFTVAYNGEDLSKRTFLPFV